VENVTPKGNKKLVAETQANSTTSSGSEHGPKSGLKEVDNGYTDERLDRMVVRTIRHRFTEILSFCLPAEIETIHVGKKDLRLIVCVPFDLPDPSPDGSKWLATRAAQNQLRREYARHLKSEGFKQIVASVFHAELAHFLFERDNIGRYPERIQELLRRIPQEVLAGRPSHSIPEDVANEISDEGAKIYRDLENIKTDIRRWKKNDSKIEDPVIQKKLSRKYPETAYSWMPFFYELIPSLPLKPYFGSKGMTGELLDDKDKPLPAKLCEPDRWSTTAAVVKILQKKLFLNRGTKYPLRGIRKILAKALRQVTN
jgi:hypothetical protein